MPRMIYWNVEHFSDDKFFIRYRKRKRDEEQPWGQDIAQHFRDVLIETITANHPDFIVIVEARPGCHAAQGTLLHNTGSLRLLRYLRFHDPQWALVPPVISGVGQAGEGILVYFRRTPTLYFTGPWHWPGGAGPAGNTGNTGVYPNPYTWAFSRPVDGRTVPPGAQYNVGRVERQLAGQWRYFAGGATVQFGGNDTRKPFRTTFYDSAAGQNYVIVACHMTPSQNGGIAGVAAAPATLGTATLGNLAEVQNAHVNETVVVAGDFNVSLFNAAATGVAYAPFAAAFTMIIDHNAGHPMPAGYPSRGYLTTHIRPDVNATPSSTRGYPAFGYMTGPHDHPHGQYDSIDNAFVQGGAVANATIANIVTGAPYTAMAVPPAVPAGALPYNSVMAQPATLNVPNGHNPNGPAFVDLTQNFQDIANYGRARGASDHLPLVFDF